MSIVGVTTTDPDRPGAWRNAGLCLAAGVVMACAMASCSKSQDEPSKLISTADPLSGVDWVKLAGPGLDCSTYPEQFFKPTAHDMTGDGTLDSFVYLTCYTGDGRYPDTIQVYDGASSSAAPTLLATLAHDLYFSGGCLTFAGQTVTLHAYDYAAGDPNSSPSLVVTQIFTWDGGSLTAGDRKVIQTDSDDGSISECG